mgnify:CR=1 FL=1
MHNVCKHQMGPLGEGKIIDGCITCPWHGYQYLPANGQSPPPFTEMVKTPLQAQEVIDYANSHRQLNENINLIQGDIHSYTTTKLYDLIIIDTIWLPHEMTEDQWQSLVTKFTNNVNPNGAIYAPVYHKWVTV